MPIKGWRICAKQAFPAHRIWQQPIEDGEFVPNKPGHSTAFGSTTGLLITSFHLLSVFLISDLGFLPPVHNLPIYDGVVHHAGKFHADERRVS
jgi:hypothetical protein